MNHESKQNQELKEQHDRAKALHDETNQQNKTAVFDALTTAGITSLELSFDGYGDNGQLNDLTAYIGRTKVATLEPQILKDAIEDLCYDLLEMTHPGWEIDEGACGRFTFDVGKRVITLLGDTRYIEYEPFEEEF